MARGRGGKELVRAGQVASVVPAAAERVAGGRAGVADLRGSRFLSSTGAADLKAALFEQARALGFDCAGVAAPEGSAHARQHFLDFLAAGAHGDMDWLAASPERRADPHVLWPHVRSIIMLGVNYGPDQNPLDLLQQRSSGAISVYAK